MFTRRKGYTSSNGSDHKSDTVIGVNSDFRGELRTDGDVQIYGVFEGDIQIAGTLVVGRAAKVKSNVRAQHASIAGAVVGDVVATGRIEIVTGASVIGDIVCGSLLIDEGAVFVGKSTMRPENEGALLLLAVSTSGDLESESPRGR